MAVEETEVAHISDEPATEPESAPDSAYEAAVDEPDWFSEDDVGGPVAGEPYEPWGAPSGSPHEPRKAWSIWDTEPVADGAEAEPEMRAAGDWVKDAADPGPGAAAGAEATEHVAAGVEETEAVEADRPAAADEGTASNEPDRTQEEPKMWLGGSSDEHAPADASRTEAPSEEARGEAEPTVAAPPEAGPRDDGDDAAAEMEVAATGWHPAEGKAADAAESTAPPPGRDWHAVELPGARELDDALAALRRHARGSAGDPPATTTPPPPTPTDAEGTSAETSPAQRAYARLRRILPG
jgi:hypothetical protein